MAVIYLPKPCNQCGYKPADKFLNQGLTFSMLATEIAYCLQCNEVVQARVGSKDMIGDVWKTEEEYIQRVAKRSPKLVDKISSLSYCLKCKSTNIQLLNLMPYPPDGLVEPDDAWIICPRCKEGKIQLEHFGWAD